MIVYLCSICNLFKYYDKMENLFVASTNLPILLPLYLSYENNDYVTGLSLLFLGIFSFTSHLFENHKHCMPGFGLSKKVSYILNRLDVLGCIILGPRLLYFAYLNPLILSWNMMLVLLILGGLNFASEYDKSSLELKNRYILLHSLWHVGIFIWIYVFLLDWYYL